MCIVRRKRSPRRTGSPPADDWPRVAAQFGERVRRVGIVGAGVLFVKDGAVAHRAVTGLQDRAAGRPVDDDTIFHWASIRKTFTGVAIMQLRDRGFFSLDDPAVKYVPELSAVHNPYGDVAQVTIRHLMTHSGGFRAGTWPWGGDQPWHPFEPTRWAQLAAMMPYTQLQFRPGTHYSYSNPGVIFLGRIIERFSGDDYETYIRSSLLEMATPQIRATDGEGGSGDDVQAGLSRFIERHGGVELVGHSGDQNGFISHLYVHRPSRSGYVVSFNTDVTSASDPRQTTRAVDDDLRDAVATAFWAGAARR